MMKYGGSHINDLRRTEGYKGHSSKPTTFRGIEGESQRYMHQGPAGHTRRQHKLFPGQAQRHIKLPDDYEPKLKKYHGSKKAHGKTGGKRRGRKSRSTRRR
jgi:hypothetical protein